MQVWFPDVCDEHGDEAVSVADGSPQRAAQEHAAADYEGQWESSDVCVRDARGELHTFGVRARVEVNFDVVRR